MSSFGGTVKLTGESEYKKALNEITGSLKVLNSEMKLVSSAYDKNNASATDLQSANQTLNKKLEEQKEKVNILKNALEDAKKETGKNSETTKKWQTELNKAQAEVNETSRKIDENTDVLKRMEKANVSNTKELKEFEEQERKAGDSSLKLGDIIKANLISEGIIAGIKGLTNAVKSVGSAFVDIGKQAMDSYGEYEQLVGGVNTLFGENGKKVQEYANNAYKTAGLSANQYMETVTSFSASMIASLNGDTAKASEVSNRAIIDMSDNVNKMGTSMESIQNAYQGFAKQNYTMLDNLKLGYGGTKTEMQRLIQDASKMTDVQKELGVTIDANDMSFANIANAISVVQKNMGIAGATSAEASTTMQGSVSAMKSSWQNLVTGIADENANMEQLVGNLVESIIGTNGEGGIIANFLPRIEEIINSIGPLLQMLGEQLIPQVIEVASGLIGSIIQTLSDNILVIINAGENILLSLLDGIMAHSTDLINLVLKLVNSLTQTVLENLPTVIKAGMDILLALINGIIEVSGELIPVIIDAVILCTETLLDNLDMIIDAGIELIFALVDGLLYALPDLIDKIPVIIDKLIMAISNNLPKLIEAGGTLLIKLAFGLSKASWQLVAQIPTIIASLVNGFKNYWSKMDEVGLNLVKGIWNGISDATGWILKQIKTFGKNVLEGIKSIFGIHSPSTLFRDEVGKNLALGVGEGFADTMADVSADMQNAIPTEFDANIGTNINMASGQSQMSTFDMMVIAFKQALTEVKVVMDDREMGTFVTDTVTKVVYA